MTWLLSLAKLLPARSWLILGALAGVLTLYAAYRYQQHRADRAEADLAPAVATVEALDKVASETPIIRQAQQEKQDAVDQIQGSDDRLPDGFGDRLQRVRDGRANPDPR